MKADLEPQVLEGLERSCERGTGDGIVTAPAFPGIERIEARFFGEAFAPHRHDSYALGVTLQGIQTFRYRGAARYSPPGGIIVLHPDELHDGGAGTEAGLRYRMLYLQPSLLSQALGGEGAALPFVRQPVLADDALRAGLLAALGPLDRGLDELAADDIVSRIAQGLARHGGQAPKPLGRLAARQVTLAREFLEANATRPVRSEELESVTGLDRFALSRHFRAMLATSPHRFLLMRRLQHARRLIDRGEPLAEVAAAAGFADQSHLSRHFKKAFGLTPGRWAALVAAGRTRR
ncbi:AraC family transcriptional regulator [Labrys monachus]|nr:AraC family transcriptional regulator [Labrys monachus]